MIFSIGAPCGGSINAAEATVALPGLVLDRCPFLLRDLRPWLLTTAALRLWTYTFSDSSCSIVDCGMPWPGLLAYRSQ